MKLLFAPLLALEITNHSIAGCQLEGAKGGENLRFINYAKLPAGTVNGELIEKEIELEKKVEVLIDKAHPKKISSKDVLLVIPDRFFYTNIFEMSSKLKGTDLENSLILEMTKYFPFSIDEVFYKYEVLKTINEKSYVKVDLVPNSFIDSYSEFLSEMGYKPKNLVCRSVSLLNALNIENDSLVIFDEPNNIEIVFIKNGHIQESVYVPKNKNLDQYLNHEINSVLNEQYIDEKLNYINKAKEDLEKEMQEKAEKEAKEAAEKAEKDAKKDAEKESAEDKEKSKKAKGEEDAQEESKVKDKSKIISEVLTPSAGNIDNINKLSLIVYYPHLNEEPEYLSLYQNAFAKIQDQLQDNCDTKYIYHSIHTVIENQDVNLKSQYLVAFGGAKYGCHKALLKKTLKL